MLRQRCAVSSRQTHPRLVVLVAVLDAPPSASAACIVPVTFAVYVAVAVSAAVTIAAANIFSTGPFSCLLSVPTAIAVTAVVFIAAHCHCPCQLSGTPT